MFDLFNLKQRWQMTIQIVYFGVHLYDARIKERTSY